MRESLIQNLAKIRLDTCRINDPTLLTPCPANQTREDCWAHALTSQLEANLKRSGKMPRDDYLKADDLFLKTPSKDEGVIETITDASHALTVVGIESKKGVVIVSFSLLLLVKIVYFSFCFWFVNKLVICRFIKLFQCQLRMKLTISLKDGTLYLKIWQKMRFQSPSLYCGFQVTSIVTEM